MKIFGRKGVYIEGWVKGVADFGSFYAQNQYILLRKVASPLKILISYLMDPTAA